MKCVSLIIALVTLGAVSSRADSVAFEAESGALGADFAVSNSTSPSYITITSNGAGNNPDSAARVATYSITFPAAGTHPALRPRRHEYFHRRQPFLRERFWDEIADQQPGLDLARKSLFP
jgi:hypothetical protein